jgi:hypothetical protein
MPTFQLLSPLVILLDLMACKKISDHFARSLDGSIFATDGFDIHHACYPCLSEVERRKDYQLHKDGFTVIALTCNDIDARISCDSVIVVVKMITLLGRIVTSIAGWQWEKAARKYFL